MAALGDTDNTNVSVTTVGPSWGDQITTKARNALFWFFVIVAGYIAVRLEWKMAVGALIAVAHDILISVGVYSIFQFEVTPATVIAFLTIMGYSLYDTIVVYDKVREISGRLSGTGRYTYSEMMNLALNQVLMRSINTSITSMLPVLSMLLIGSLFLGALTLQEFAIALLIGILVGSYSSIFVASSLVAIMKEREEINVAVRRKVDARGLGDGGTRSVAADDAALGSITRRPTADRPRPGNAPPRPRKKKKKR
jgi:preprotein translocase subunit SecF